MFYSRKGLIFKDSVYIPDFDTFPVMLNELGIEESFENRSTLFVRAGLEPIDDRIFDSVSSWWV